MSKARETTSPASQGPSADATPDRSHGRSWVFRLLGLVMAAVVYLALGGTELSEDARRVAAIGALMATCG